MSPETSIGQLRQLEESNAGTLNLSELSVTPMPPCIALTILLAKLKLERLTKKVYKLSLNSANMAHRTDGQQKDVHCAEIQRKTLVR